MKSASRVVTLTLHPAIDRVIGIESMQPGGTFNARERLTIPAGKGVNTARVLRTLCGPRQKIVAAVWAGAGEADFFKTKLREIAGIECAVCPRKCATRFAQTYLEADGRETHIKEAMRPPSAGETRAFLEFWRKLLRKGDIVAICGSAPPGMKVSELKTVFKIAHERGASAIVADTNGRALIAAAQSAIHILKGNATEIGALLGLDGPFNSGDRSHCRLAAELVTKPGAPLSILITLGADGALLVLCGRIFYSKMDTKYLKHKIASTTGCGDAATAGAIWGIRDTRAKDVDLLRRAVACGAAKTLSADPGKISLKSVSAFVRYSQVKRIEIV